VHGRASATDKTFPLNKITGVLAMMTAAQHFGKIVLTM
jgi:hypothetical protein